MLHWPKIIAGQEQGKKTEHLAEMSGDGRYDDDKKLMIGDAPGDQKPPKPPAASSSPSTPATKKTPGNASTTRP